MGGALKRSCLDKTFCMESNTLECKVVKISLQQSGDTMHLVPDFTRKLSISDAEPDQEPVCPAPGLSDITEKVTLSSLDKAASTFDCKQEYNKTSDAGKFNCSCGETFLKSVHLASHKRWSCKFKEKTAKCEVCSGWFATDVGLKRHMKHAHGGIVSCDSCNLRFPNNIKLTQHWIEAHHDEKNEEFKILKCYVCNDTNFENKFELECHLVVHKYEKHQQKMTDHGLWSQQSSAHFTPYPHLPFLRTPFSNLSRPACHFLPFHRPSMPFPHPPPFYPPPFPQAPFPYHQAMFHSPSSMSSTQASCSSPAEETASSFPAHENIKVSSPKQNFTSSNPHHDHIFVDTVPPSPYFSQHFHHTKHGKLKWKKYLKLMIKGKLPMIWPGRLFPYAKDTDMGEASNQNASKEKENEQCEFKIACKFCDNIIQRNKINWHQRRECPVLAVHKCAVCDRVFRKRHFLIRHMHEQNHYTVSSQPSSTAPPSDVHSSNLSVIQEKLNSSLKLLNVSETFSVDISKDSQCNVQKIASDKDPTAVNTANGKCENAEATEANILNSRFCSECAVCKHAFFNKEMLCEHLRGHLSQILAIQKVHEWTVKSSDYFFLGDPDDEQDLTTATSSSCLDTEITSTTESLVPENSSDTSDLKWTKPHTKRNSHHIKGELLLCEFCNEQFSFRKDLHYHMETQHKDCSLKCPLCKKKFSWKKRGKFYERHLNSHFGVKVFKHKCEVCGKTFLENSKLRAHMSLHNNDLLHRCTVCQKGYANKSSLVRHERMHTGVKPYQCDLCSESFMEKRELLRHSTTHTGVAPFNCSDCGQGFTLKTSLMSHMKKKHSK
ncbi:hypothetical protein Btru_011900 [Bulinus truncatus]|nr:hypothetical protein Btru_011900 [Bulinus truncatus]